MAESASKSTPERPRKKRKQRRPRVLDAMGWEALKQARLKGVSYRSLSQTFGLSEATIRGRACREKWPRSAPAPRKDSAQIVARRQVSERANEVITRSLHEIGSDNAMYVAEKASALLRSSLSGQGDSPLRAPDNWQDVERAFRVVEKATGRDAPKTQIGISISAGGWSSRGPALTLGGPED